MKKPTAREYQYEKLFCFIFRDACVDCCELIDPNGRRNNCSNCKIALEHKNKKEMDK